MLVIVFGVLAAVFFLTSIILIAYICRRRRNGMYCKQKPECEITQSSFGYSMQETGIHQSNQSAVQKTKLHSEAHIVPFKPLQTSEELPYDPNYAEIFFHSPNSGPISLSSRSGSSSSYECYKEMQRKNTLQTPTPSKEQIKTPENRNLLDPDTGLVPFTEYEL